MKKKNYKGRVDKRVLGKCKDVVRTYSDIAYKYADFLQEDPGIKEFRCNVVLDGCLL